MIEVDLIKFEYRYPQTEGLLIHQTILYHLPAPGFDNIELKDGRVFFVQFILHEENAKRIKIFVSEWQH